jgi:hypothetical protein
MVQQYIKLTWDLYLNLSGGVRVGASAVAVGTVVVVGHLLRGTLITFHSQ